MSEDLNILFKKVIQEIKVDVRLMVEQLWRNWSDLGLDYNSKEENLNKLVDLEKDFHRNIISESSKLIETMQEQIDNLKEESVALSKLLSIDIINFNEDLKLYEVKSLLQEQINGYRKQVEQRRIQMKRLLEWQCDLSDKLGLTIQEFEQMPLPSEEELEKLRIYLEDLQSERNRRMEIFMNSQLEIKDIMEKLQITPQNSFEHEIITSLSVDFKVTDLNMETLTKLKQDLQDKYEETYNRVLELRECLSRHWQYLNVDQIYCENFLQAHPGCNPLTETAIIEEVMRCKKLKQQKIECGRSRW